MLLLIFLVGAFIGSSFPTTTTFFDLSNNSFSVPLSTGTTLFFFFSIIFKANIQTRIVYTLLLNDNNITKFTVPDLAYLGVGNITNFQIAGNSNFLLILYYIIRIYDWYPAENHSTWIFTGSRCIS